MTVSELRTFVDNIEEYIHIPGGIDRLKKTVLHLAVTGQLVPQDPSEGTGEQLYQKIQAEKAELVKQGKVKKQKAVADVDHDELPFIIPASWRWARLGSILSKVTDGSHNPPKGTVEGLPMLSSRNVTEKGLDFKNIRFLSDLDFANENKRTDIQVDDILLTIVGSIGRSLVVNESHGKFTLQRSVAVLTPIACDPYYVSSVFIQSPFMQETLDNEATGTAQRGIYLNQIKMLHIPLPPFAEQKRIVAKVDSIFALIDDLAMKHTEAEARRQKLLGNLFGTFSDENNDKALELLPELIRSKDDAWWLRGFILHQAVSGRLTQSDSSTENAHELYKRILRERTKTLLVSRKVLPDISEHEVDYELPENWCWVRLGEVTNYGKTEKRKPVDIEENTWLLELEDIEKHTSRLISRVASKERSPSSDKNVFRKGDVLYGKLRPYLDKVIIADSDGVCSSEILPIRAYGDAVHPEYLLIVMKSPNFVATVNEMTYGVKMPRLGTEDGRKMPIPLAPYMEQLEIVKKTKQLLNLVTKLESVFESPHAPTEIVLIKDNRWWFALKQGVGSVIDKLSQTQYERGEMVIAKYMYLLQEVYKVPFGLQFVKHQFGPYDPDIKKAILSSAFNKDKFFTVKGSGVKQVYSLGSKSDTLMKYSSDVLASAKLSLDELMQYTANAKSRDIERLATVCKIIQDSQSNDEHVVVNEMKAWKNDKFSPDEVKKTLAFICQKGWDARLIKGVRT